MYYYSYSGSVKEKSTKIYSIVYDLSTATLISYGNNAHLEHISYNFNIYLDMEKL